MGPKVGQKGLDLRTKSIKPLIKSIKPMPTVPQSRNGFPAGLRIGQKGLNPGQKALNPLIKSIKPLPTVPQGFNGVLGVGGT
jgi:hypothetical protein